MVGIPGAFIPNKVRSEDPETDNEMLKGSTILNTVLRNGDTIWIEFNQDGGKVTKWENETFYQTHGKDFVEERDTYEVVEDEDDEPEIADEEFYSDRKPKVKTAKKERRRSFFLEKAVESEFKAFFETKQTYRKCFKVDWKKVKKLKWMKEQLPEFKACISKHYPLFVNIYQFYSATGEGDPFDMGMNDFQVLLRACNIGDVYLGSVWYAVNFHGKASIRPSKDSKSVDHDMDKNALSRYEFIEVLFRLGAEIFAKSKEMKAARRKRLEQERKKKRWRKNSKLKVEMWRRMRMKKLAKLLLLPAAETTPVSRTFLNTNQCETMLECIEAMFNIIAEEAFKTVDLAELHYADPDSFRRERLYFVEVSDVFLKYSDRLYTIFTEYADKSMDRAHSTGSKEPKLCLEEYYDLLNISGASKGLSKGEITLAFVASQMHSADPLGSKRKRASDDNNDRCTFMEFCDCLARLADFKADGYGLDREVSIEKLPKLSGVLETFLNKLCSGFSRSFWNANPVQSYAKYVDVKYGGYERLRKKYGDGPEEGRSEDDATDEEQRNRIELRSQSAIKMPKELEERIDTRDALRRKEYLKAQKIIREQKLKEEVMARRRAGSMAGTNSGRMSKR